MLLTNEGRGKDDDARTRLLFLSKFPEELQDAVNFACREVFCSVRSTNYPKSQHHWEQLVQGLPEGLGQVLWTHVLAGVHYQQKPHHLNADEGLESTN